MNTTEFDFSVFLDTIAEDKKEMIIQLRKTVLQNLPGGYEESISNNMLHYVVPYSIYPDGYHCKPKQPLPFMSIAAQKNFVALYHMGIYADADLLNWFQNSYTRMVSTKLDMGKSCIRFKKLEQIPMNLIAELCTKITPEQWVSIYIKNYKK